MFLLLYFHVFFSIMFLFKLKKECDRTDNFLFIINQTEKSLKELPSLARKFKRFVSHFLWMRMAVARGSKIDSNMWITIGELNPRGSFSFVMLALRNMNMCILYGIYVYGVIKCFHYIHICIYTYMIDDFSYSKE